MKAFVLIKIRSGEIPETLQSIRKTKNVLEADMTFGPFDAVVSIQAQDLNELGKVVASSIQCIPGVLETLTCLTVDI